MGSDDLSVEATVAPNPCDAVKATQAFFLVVFIIPAFCLVIILSFIKRRKKLCLGCCSGRPGILYPINFVDDHARRWASAAVFALLSYRVLMLFEGGLFLKPDEFDDPVWMKTYGWVRVFVAMANAIVMAMIYYPLLGAIVCRHSIIANILGLLYLAPLLWEMAELWKLCPVDTGSEDEEQRLNGILQVTFDVPMLICYVLLVIVYLVDLVKNIRRIIHNRNSKEKKREEPLPIQYVRQLLKRPPRNTPTTFIEKIKNCCSYERVQGFHYSSRIICTMVVALFALFRTATEIEVFADVTFAQLRPLVESEFVGDMLFDTFPNVSNIHSTIIKSYDALHYSFTVSNSLSFILHCLFVVHMVLCYRRHILKMYRGNRNWHFKYVPSPVSDMVAGMKYSGYQIAYIIYGYLILFIILLLVCCLLAFGFILPLVCDYPSLLIDKIIELWPGIVVAIAIYVIQILAVRFCFLQNFGASMALNNRRIYHVVSFFMFIFNIIVGLFACLKRILLSLVFGTILVSRLDKNLYMRGFERFDSGFKAYLGMLSVDLHHNHPVMKAFILLLQQDVANKCMECGKTNDKSRKDDAVENGDLAKKKTSPADNRSRMWRCKWRKAVTLINNPILVVERLKEIVQQNRTDYSKEIADQTLHQIANIGTVVVASAALSTADIEIDTPF